MFNKPFSPSRGSRVVSAAALGIALAVLGSKAFSAQDKYTLRVPFPGSTHPTAQVDVMNSDGTAL
jgi:hypothetical protein